MEAVVLSSFQSLSVTGAPRGAVQGQPDELFSLYPEVSMQQPWGKQGQPDELFCLYPEVSVQQPWGKLRFFVQVSRQGSFDGVRI